MFDCSLRGGNFSISKDLSNIIVIRSVTDFLSVLSLAVYLWQIRVVFFYYYVHEMISITNKQKKSTCHFTAMQ